MSAQLPAEFEAWKEAAIRALGPVVPADSTTHLEGEFPFFGNRTRAGRNLPPYYLVYFLLVDLLGFRSYGRSEKVAWSVPIDYQGRGFAIEHRKLGLGVFAHEPKEEEKEAMAIVEHVRKAVDVAQPYFDWLADQAVDASAVNVVNNAKGLFDRYIYFRNASRLKSREADERDGETIEEEGESEDGHRWTTILFPSFELRKEAGWLAISATEAFFGWTEHVFIHLSILNGQLVGAKAVSELANSNWPTKFEAALDIADPSVEDHYDKLISIRREVRNYVAHGAFGKQGEAFNFHSAAGAVPVLLPHRSGVRNFRLGDGLEFDSAAALETVDEFVTFFWSGDRAPAEIYIQQSGLPLIMTMAADGSYGAAMESLESMTELVDHLSYQFDQAANMDW